MSTLNVSDIYEINFQEDVDSYPLRENFANIKSAINDNQSQINNISGAESTNEVVQARDYADSLKDRLNQASRNQKNVVISGLLTTEQGTPNMTVQVSSGYALVNGILNYKSSTTNTGTITAPTNKRWDVVVINSDNTISVVSGNDSNDRVLPAIASSQRPLAIIDLDSATASITNSLITDCSEMGCYVDQFWFWKIQDAVDSLDDRTNATEQGTIFIRKGDYYEEVDLTGISNVELNFERGAKIMRTSNTTRCLKSINTVSNETTGIKVIGGYLDGNSKAGSLELMKFEYTDAFVVNDFTFIGNASSSATYKNFVIDNCDGYKVTNLFPYEDDENDVVGNSINVVNSREKNYRILDTGWVNRSDWTDVDLGCVEVQYDNLSGTFQVGELITGGTSTSTGIIISDSGTNLVLKEVTNGGIFTNNEVITGSISSATADVNEVSGDNKNQDTNVEHNMNKNISDLDVRLFVSTDGTDNNSFIIGNFAVFDGNDTSIGQTHHQDDKNTFHMATGDGGITYMEGGLSDPGSAKTITNDDWYYKIIISQTGVYYENINYFINFITY
jgi:hypothetical protein